MNREYKVIPFAEVKIGQEFDIDRPFVAFKCHYIKIGDTSCKNAVGDHVHEMKLDFPCLVRIADCEPELDFDTWWKTKGASIGYSGEVAVACKAAWDAAKAKEGV